MCMCWKVGREGLNCTKLFFILQEMTSAHDKAILNSIFNPLLPVGDCVYDEDIPEELKGKPHSFSLVLKKRKIAFGGTCSSISKY